MRITKPVGGVKWVIWSRRNLAITAAVVGLVLFVFGHASGPSKAATPAPPSVTATAEPEAPTYTPDPTTSTTVPTEDPHMDLMKTATAFATAWARPSLTAPVWRAGVAPWVTPKLAKGLSTTDPARVPSTKLIGEPMTLRYGPGWTWAWVQVKTDGGNIVLSMVSTGADVFSRSWLVNDVAPAGPGATQ